MKSKSSRFTEAKWFNSASLSFTNEYARKGYASLWVNTGLASDENDPVE
jgi:hypothetical protein